MPKVLTMTQKPDESPEQFADRISGQVSEFFGGSPEDAAESTEPAPAGEPDSSPEPTDVTAPSEQPDENG